MTEQERNLIRDAMMFAVKDISGRIMREATVQSMIDDFKKAIDYTQCSIQLLCVNKEDDNSITKGYEYKCIEKDKTHYKIIDNYSYEGWFPKKLFKELK